MGVELELKGVTLQVGGPGRRAYAGGKGWDQPVATEVDVMDS